MEEPIYDPEYLEMVKFLQSKGKQPNWTRTQSLFAMFLLKNKHEIAKIGDLESVFKDVQRFAKETR